MKRLGCILILATGLCAPAFGLSLKPITGGSFDGVPLARAMATLDVLGAWNLPKDGWVKIFVAAGLDENGCDGRDSDADHCHDGRLYVSVQASDALPMDYALFRGPNGVDWRLPKNENLKILSADEFSIRLCGYQTPSQGSHAALFDYILHLHRYRAGNGHIAFSGTLEKKNERDGEIGGNGCSPLMPPPEFALPEKH